VVLQPFGRSHFGARVEVGEASIAAFAQGMVTGVTGWLGNIILRPEARRRGPLARLSPPAGERERERAGVTRPALPYSATLP